MVVPSTTLRSTNSQYGKHTPYGTSQNILLLMTVSVFTAVCVPFLQLRGAVTHCALCKKCAEKGHGFGVFRVAKKGTCG